MNKRFIAIIFIASSAILAVILYKNSRKSEENKEILELYSNQPSSSIVTLKHKILHEGNEKAYMELYNFLIMDQWKPDEFLYWAFIWANKYEKPEGYYDVYFCLVESCYADTTKHPDYNERYPSCNIEKDGVRYSSHSHLDKKTFDFAFKYLNIAAEKGSINAKLELERLELENKKRKD